MIALGERIKESRKKLKLTQEALGGGIFTKSYISQIERGIITPSVKALEILANRLDKPLSFLLEDNSIPTYDSSLLLDAKNLYYRGKYESSLKLYNEILSTNDEAINKETIPIYYNIAKLHLKLNNFNDAINHCNIFINRIDIHNNIYGYKSYLLIGHAYYNLNNKEKSLEFLLKVEKILDNNSFHITTSKLLKLYKYIGKLYGILSNTDLSIDYFKKAIYISKKENLITSDVLYSLRALSDIYWLKRDNIKTIKYLDELLPLHNYFIDHDNLPSIYSKYAMIHFDNGNFEKSEEFLNKLYNTLPNINDSFLKSENLAYYYLYMGKLLQIKGNLDMALVKVLEALKEVTIKNPSIEMLQCRGIILLNTSKFYYDTKDSNNALKLALEAEEILRGTGLTSFLAELYRLMAKIYISLNRVEIAEVCYDEAFKILNDKE